MDWSSIIVAVSAIGSTGIIYITAIFAYRQLEKSAIANQESAKANRLTAFISFINYVQKEEVRNARNYLFSTLKNKNYKKWSEPDKKIAERACHPYDTIAIMASEKLISKKIVLKWADSITKCWETAKPMIDDYRKNRSDPDFWIDFENLYNKAKKK